MNCREARQSISPYLDGVLDSKETLLVQLHLDGCQQCRADYRDQVRLSELLRFMGKDIKPAPPGFKDAVMQAVQTEAARAARPRLRAAWAKLSWKKAWPAVAAAVFLVFASLNGFLPDNRGMDHIAVQDGSQSEVTPNATVEPNQIVSPGAVTVTTPESPAATVKPEGPVVIAENPPTDPSLMLPPSTSVLLSMEDRNILTTMLVVRSQEDQGAVGEQVQSVAARCGGSVEKLGQQVKDGVSYNLFKITVDRGENNTLLSRLSSLGTVVTRDEDRQDISQAYTQALEQFLRLSTQRGESKDPAEIKRLEQQITGLQKQLSDWKRQAGMSTVVLWVQD
ncbi:MAG: zf-HC2 domain-containing protein [Syntrophomonadaceae bacterium]